jgi:uncharacterized protein
LPAQNRDFQIFAKPTGPLCNLNCAYCYYLKRQDLFPEASSFRMTDEMLERYIVQHIQATTERTISFSWHGGEPTVLGLDYFRKIVELQRKHAPEGKRIENGMQTNGVLIDDEWARFLSAERFNIGLSLDGPAELHDPYRVARGGQPTHRQVVRAFELLMKRSVALSIICVVHNLNVRQPFSVYRFFRSIGAPFIGFLPVVELDSETGQVTPETPAAEEYGEFLCRIFDEWRARNAGRIGIQIFDEASRPLRGMEHSLCVFRETCGQIPVLEHNGDFFPCDHYVDADRKLGNITVTPLSQLLDGEALRAFGDAKRDTLPRYCRECEVLAYCNGGCPKYRFIATPDGDPGLNYLCAGLKRFFLHARDPLARMLGIHDAGPFAASRSTAQSVSRNDACPCGSGLKYKKCCGANR